MYFTVFSKQNYLALPEAGKQKLASWDASLVDGSCLIGIWLVNGIKLLSESCTHYNIQVSGQDNAKPNAGLDTYL